MGTAELDAAREAEACAKEDIDARETEATLAADEIAELKTDLQEARHDLDEAHEKMRDLERVYSVF